MKYTRDTLVPGNYYKYILGHGFWIFLFTGLSEYDTINGTGIWTNKKMSSKLDYYQTNINLMFSDSDYEIHKITDASEEEAAHLTACMLLNKFIPLQLENKI